MGASPLLTLRHVSKRFGAVQALTDVELEIRSGEVVALLGDSGAGKSALVKVLAGVFPADEGVITWEGQTVRIRHPSDAQNLGISTVHQDLTLCDSFDVLGNLFLGREPRRLGLLGRLCRLVDTGGMRWEARRQLGEFQLPVPDLRTPVSSLSRSQRQIVALFRSLLGDPKVLLLDEPTAALDIRQSRQVLDLVEQMRDRGLGVLLINHNMGDIKAVADRIAVLRLGRNNGFFDADTTSQEQIIAAVTGATDNAVAQRGIWGRRAGP